jgi:sugar/nucleoside kinase (ribokinase family)
VTAPIRRLVSVGNVVIDLVATIPALPERGGDVLASSGRLEPGGGFNLMVAARRQGLPTAYAGTTGTGPFGDMARAALARADIIMLQEPVAGMDTGFDVAMVDADGERTFVTVVGAEGELTADRLDRVTVLPSDAFALSGYGPLHPANRAAILPRLPRLDPDTTVVFDPGPLGHEIPVADLDVVLARADWWSGNAREARLATGLDDPSEAAAALADRLARGGVVVRMGAGGCVLCKAGSRPFLVPGFAGEAVDTTGAGDAHVGAFVAALAAGLDPVRAARRANAVAAIAVTRTGPASSPGRDEADAFLRSRG